MIYFKINEIETDLSNPIGIVLQSNKLKNSVPFFTNKDGKVIENEDYEYDNYIIDMEETKPVAGNCGVTSFDGLNDLSDFLKSYNSFCSRNIKLVIDYIINDSHESIILFSTNEDHSELIPIMDRLCNFKSKSIININSKNVIKLWGFYNPKAKFPSKKPQTEIEKLKNDFNSKNNK